MPTCAIPCVFPSSIAPRLARVTISPNFASLSCIWWQIFRNIYTFSFFVYMRSRGTQRNASHYSWVENTCSLRAGVCPWPPSATHSTKCSSYRTTHRSLAMEIGYTDRVQPPGCECSGILLLSMFYFCFFR